MRVGSRWVWAVVLGSLSLGSAAEDFSLSGTRSWLGFNVGRAYSDAKCAATLLVCESRDRSAQLRAGTMFSRSWGAELGWVDTGKFARIGSESRAHGLGVSLVGRTQIFPTLGVFGKVGTSYGRSETSVMGNSGASAPDSGFGLSFGAGLSYEVTPNLSATFEWASYDLRLASGAVRTTNLGLQFRY